MYIIMRIIFVMARNARAKVIEVLDDYCGIDYEFLNFDAGA